MRLRVCDAPLVIRASEDLESDQIGIIYPGEMMTVLMERVARGKVRLRFMCEESMGRGEGVGVGEG